MIKYDKIIVDTYQYYHRVACTTISKKAQDIVKVYISNINKLLNSTYGEVYLLFDPSASANKQKTASRKETCKAYKENRKKFEMSAEGKLKMEVMDLLGSTLLLYPKHRVHLYQHPEYEADDYVEKLTASGNCLLVTTDEDWARYLVPNRVDMLISGLVPEEANLFTSKNFEEKYGFKPTIATVSIWKALMSDESDNIMGVYKNSKHIVLKEAVDETVEALKKIAEENISVDVASYMFHNGQGHFTKVKQLLELSCTEKSMEKLNESFSNNLQLIGSLIPNSCDIKIENLEVKLDIFKTSKPFSLNRR